MQKKQKKHIQLHFLGRDLQEIHLLERIADEKRFPLVNRGVTVPETLLATRAQPNPHPQSPEQLKVIALGKLVPGRFSHIVVAKNNKQMKALAATLKAELQDLGIYITILNF